MTKKSEANESMDVDSVDVTGAPNTDKGQNIDKKEKSSDVLTLDDLKEQCRWIERGEASREYRYVSRVMRGLRATRKRMQAPILARLISFYFVGQNVSKQKEYLLQCLKASADAAKALEVQAMDVDAVTGSIPPRSPKPKRPGSAGMSVVLLPEVEAYIHLLVVLFLIDKNRLSEAELCIEKLMERIIPLNRRSLDPISARAYYVYSLIYEKQNKLPSIRNLLHNRLRTATLRHDEDGQAVLINCLLRSYLQENLFDLAGKLVAKVTFPETANNNEWARYLYYLGRIKAMQLEYAAAYKHMQQAQRKAPQHAAAGFKQSVQKMLVVVELLLGEIPDRPVFRQPLYRKSLQPYFLLTQAVRLGDVPRFNLVLQQSKGAFERDGTYSLVIRLRQNVIRTAVKQISLAYSRISIEDIQRKLQLTALADAEYIVSKAIHDGVIDAIINHAEGYVQSRETSDVYSTTEPQQQFHNRINFCLQIYNQSVKAMRFPPKSYNKDLESAEERREREQQDLEFAKEMAEEEDDDFP